MMNFLQSLGRLMLGFLAETGKVAFLLSDILKNSFYLPKDRKLFFAQAYEIGIRSLVLIVCIAFFTGMVVAYQSGEQMVKMMPLTYLGLTVYKMMTMELGPVLTGIIMAGRYGSSVAAELGTMKVTEQIDALKSMAIDPVRYLGVPRFFGAMLMLPVCVIFADVMGIFGGFAISNLAYGVSIPEYVNEIQNYFKIMDIAIGLVKSLVFGAIISLIGCYVGFGTYGGAEGVGKATVRSFVITSVLILISDLLVAMMML